MTANEVNGKPIAILTADMNGYSNHHEEDP